MATGIVKRHSKGCPGKEGKRCRCNAGYEASVYSKREGKKIRKTFASAAAAKSWRSDVMRAVERGDMRSPARTTLREAWSEFYEGAKAGTVRTRSGDRYKPATLRSYERAMRLRVLPRFGRSRITDLDRVGLQGLVETMLADDDKPSTIRQAIAATRAVLRRQMKKGEITRNPADGLDLPAARGRRERIAAPDEAERLLGALPADDRALWAAALYGGLRRGELQALREERINLASGVIEVRKGWDQVEGEIDLKSGAGRRDVPIPAILRSYLIEHRMRRGAEPGALTFGRTASSPFDPKAANDRAYDAWEAAGLDRISLHECRHTFASLMIAAGVNPKALQEFMGHANISITLDQYGHLMPGAHAEAASLLEDYLTAERERQKEQARGATGAQAGARATDPLAA